MGEFSQNGVVANLHDFSTRTTDQIEKDLLTDKIICYPTKEAVYATRIRRFFQHAL